MRQELNHLVGTRDEAVGKLGEWDLDGATAERLVSEVAGKPSWESSFCPILPPAGQHGNIAYVLHDEGEYHVWAEL